HDRRTGGLGVLIVGPAVGDDHVSALGLAAADLVGLGDAPAERVVAHAAQHQHAVAVHELGVRHAVGIVVVYRMFLEAEGVAQPGDHGVGVAVTQAGDQGAAVGGVRHGVLRVVGGCSLRLPRGAVL